MKCDPLLEACNYLTAAPIWLALILGGFVVCVVAAVVIRNLSDIEFK